MCVRSSKEGAPGREAILQMLEGENKAAFASSTSLPAPLIIQSGLPLLLSASPLHGKGGDRHGGLFFFIFFFSLFIFFANGCISFVVMGVGG